MWFVPYLLWRFYSMVFHSYVWSAETSTISLILKLIDSPPPCNQHCSCWWYVLWYVQARGHRSSCPVGVWTCACRDSWRKMETFCKELNILGPRKKNCHHSAIAFLTPFNSAQLGFNSTIFQYSKAGSENSMAPTRRQAIIWTNGGEFTNVCMHHSASRS